MGRPQRRRVTYPRSTEILEMVHQFCMDFASQRKKVKCVVVHIECLILHLSALFWRLSRPRLHTSFLQNPNFLEQRVQASPSPQVSLPAAAFLSASRSVVPPPTPSLFGLGCFDFRANFVFILFLGWKQRGAPSLTGERSSSTAHSGKCEAFFAAGFVPRVLVDLP